MRFLKQVKLLTVCCFGVGVLFFLLPMLRTTITANVASVFFAESRPADTLRAKYEVVAPSSKAIRILLVDGHEPHFGGAEYRDLYERDMTVQLSQFLAAYLEQDSRFQVLQTRDTEDWNPVLAHYFTTNASATALFYAEKKDEMESLIDIGLVQTVSSTPHNSARADVAQRLYSINDWANEQKVDLVVNIHFNDIGRKDVTVPGPYSGFTIYVPERQYSNSSSSRLVADAVLKRLKTVVAVSDLKPESSGVVEDQDLISIGRYNTLDAPGILVEYGYIYERQFTIPDIRQAVIKEMAFETAVGIQNFFATPGVEHIPPASTLLPFTWESELLPTKQPTLPVLSLQAALHAEGYYPSATSTFHDCPLSGYFDSCTKNALIKFQADHGVTEELGMLGSTTREILNRKFSVQK
jgi:N-acetylmuramoyl-L-alanine amidase